MSDQEQEHPGTGDVSEGIEAPADGSTHELSSEGLTAAQPGASGNTFTVTADPSVQAPEDELALLDDDAEPQPWPYNDDSPQTRPTAQLSAVPAAASTREEQFAFLRDAHDGPDVWKALCLALAHEAAGIPGGVPSAHAAQILVAPSDRVMHVRNLRRGMVAFFDNPDDDNPFGHVVTVAGWATTQPTDSLNDVVTWTNDALRLGGVDLVRASFFPTHWNVPLVYGAVTLNGWSLPGYAAPTPVPGPTLRSTLDAAILTVRKGIAVQRARQHPRKVAALLRDLHLLLDQRAELS